VLAPEYCTMRISPSALDSCFTTLPFSL